METIQLRRYLLGALVGLVVALAISIEPTQKFINEAFNRGTLKGLENCIRYESSDLLSAEAIKASCVQTFQTQLVPPELVTGEAGPRVDQGIVYWEGSATSKTSDHVLTWIQVWIITFDDIGRKTEYFSDTLIWIEPLGKADFLLRLREVEPRSIDGLKYCQAGEDNPKACMLWAITDIKGLEL